MPLSRYRRVQGGLRPAPVERRRPAAVSGRASSGRDEEPGRTGHFAMEVARVELDPPDDLVDAAQLGDGELPPAERGCKRRVLELRPRPLEAVLEYPVVVEGEACVEQLVH